MSGRGSTIPGRGRFQLGGVAWTVLTAPGVMAVVFSPEFEKTACPED